jgi:hypothetical protein
MAAPKKSSSNKTSVKTQKQAEASMESAFQLQSEAMDKNSSRYKVIEAHHEKTLAQLDSIYQKIKLNNNLTTEQAKAAKAAAAKYAEHKKLQADISQQVKDRIISEEQAKKILNKSRVEFDGMVRSAKLTGKETAALRKELKSVSQEMDLASKAFDKTEKKAQLLNAAMDQFGSSNIPMMREFSQVLQGIASKDLAAVRMALTAAGAAAAVLAKNYFFPEMKAAQDVENEVKQMKTDNIADLAKIENKRATTIIKGVKNKSTLEKKIGLEISQNSIDTTNDVNRLNVDAAYASQRAANQFSATIKSAAAEFSAASKTAFFGKGLGSVSYSTAQLQLAGVSADQIAGSLSAASNAMGKNVSSELAADMAIMSKRTGQSAENLASVTEYFMRTDKVGAKSAINMQEGLRAMADSANVDLGGVMEEVAQASKEALGYQIKSGPALAKQVIYAKSLGVSFNDVAKAGKSMVLNYKDSIKNEMQLSAMLGRNVNLSEARSLFAQGKNDEALKSIKAQGLDPAKMNIFQQETLQQALGGLDLSSIQKITQNQGRTGGELSGVNANKANKGFLQTTTTAQATLSSQQANIQAQQAIIDAKLSGEITKAYLASPGYTTYQNALIDQEKQAMKVAQEEELRFKNSKDYLAQLISTAKNNIENMFSEDNFKTLGVGLAGALAGNVLGKGIEALVGGIQKVFVVNQDGGGLLDMFKKKGKNPAGPLTKSGKPDGRFKANKPSVPKTPSKSVVKATEKSVVKQTEKQVAKQAAKQAAKQGGKSAAKALGKTLLKKIPFVGLAASLFFAGQRAMAGDFAGAGLEVASGGASMLPGFGTAASVGIDAALAARDMGAFDSANPQATIKNGKVVPKTVVAKTATPPAAAKPSQVLSDVQYQTRLQMKMVELLGVSSTLLQYILIETDKDKSIQLNSVRLNQSLMNNARKQMAIGRRETVGANPSMT